MTAPVVSVADGDRWFDLVQIPNTQVSGNARPAVSAMRLGLTVPNDFMAPVLCAGDPVIVDTSHAAIDCCGLFAVRIGGVELVARFQPMFDGSVVIIPGDEQRSRQKLSAAQVRKISVLGRVVWPRV